MPNHPVYTVEIARDFVEEFRDWTPVTIGTEPRPMEFRVIPNDDGTAQVVFRIVEDAA